MVRYLEHTSYPKGHPHFVARHLGTSVQMKKTYILAPNFDYFPRGPIDLGHVWINPKDPGLPKDVQIHKTWKTDWVSERENQRQGLLSIWARFLQILGIDAESRIS